MTFTATENSVPAAQELDLKQLAKEKKKELKRLEKELKKLEELQKKKLKLNSPEIKELSIRINQLAADHLITPEQVIEMLSEGVKKYGSKKRRSSRGPVPPKYQNPENPLQTWTGRGRTPKWVQYYLEKGKTLKDLEIKENQESKVVA